MSKTTQLWAVIRSAGSERESNTRPVLPKMLIDALRNALEVGLSCEQIVACLWLMAGLNVMGAGMGSDEMVVRCREISMVMQEDSKILQACTNPHLLKVKK